VGSIFILYVEVGLVAHRQQMIVIDFREPIALFVAGQPFHQFLEQMRACHILLASWNDSIFAVV
jgi:hypothetical protein